MSKKKNNSLLWKISGKQAKDVSYLFGTIHVRDKRVFNHKEFLHQKIETCDAYYGEFKLDDADPQLLAQFMLLPEGEVLTDHLTKKQVKSLDKILMKNAGVPLERVARHMPVLLINMLTESNFNSDMELSLDEYLYNHAKLNGKRLDGLETFEEQLQVLKKIALKDQVKSLVAIVKKYNTFSRQLRKMTKYYLKMDIQQLYKSTRKNSKGMRKILLFKRNKIMARRIGEIVQNETAFIAVGAGHLAGGKGVLRYLKKQGYTIKPVKFHAKE